MGVREHLLLFRIRKKISGSAKNFPIHFLLRMRENSPPPPAHARKFSSSSCACVKILQSHPQPHPQRYPQRYPHLLRMRENSQAHLPRMRRYLHSVTHNLTHNLTHSIAQKPYLGLRAHLLRMRHAHAQVSPQRYPQPHPQPHPQHYPQHCRVTLGNAVVDYLKSQTQRRKVSRYLTRATLWKHLGRLLGIPNATQKGVAFYNQKTPW